MTLSPLANGYILGWSVAWPPGPINAEMIRRGLLPKDRGGGFWSAWPIGLGACTGDFIWAFGVSVGAGALLNSVEIRRVLAIVSLALLLLLAVRFAIGAWKIYRAHRSVEFQAPKSERRGGFLFGLFVVLMSPWKVGFWLVVIGSRSRPKPSPLRLCYGLPFGSCSIFHEPDYRTTDCNPDDQRDLSLDSG
jgi:threonine/homoserine/homoserine lactone efflux protein